MAGTISTHVLDTALGKPAAGIAVRLYRGQALLAQAVTDADGRCRPLYTATPLPPGAYCLHFAVGPYFAALSTATLYPEISIAFQVTSPSTSSSPGDSYHLPLLLNPFGYTTYRGS